MRVREYASTAQDAPADVNENEAGPGCGVAQDPSRKAAHAGMSCQAAKHCACVRTEDSVSDTEYAEKENAAGLNANRSPSFYSILETWNRRAARFRGSPAVRGSQHAAASPERSTEE